MTSHATCIRPSLFAIFRAFLRLGLTAFGGPAMVPYIRTMAVDKKHWLDETTFRTGVALTQAIPGATAMQVAAYVGLRARGAVGALAAYLGFGLPAFFLVLALSFIYVKYNDVSWVLTAFAGLKIMIVALVAHACLNFLLKYVKNPVDICLAVGSGLWLGFRLSPIPAILGACALGMILYKQITQGAPLSDQARECGKVRVWRPVILSVLVLVAGLAALYFFDQEIFDLALLMAKIDMFAFGGGYVSVPLMLHEVVEARGWMTAQTFMDGIAMGQVTPGPIVMTATFLGYFLFGLVGAVVATIYVFAPSYLILAATVPFVDRLLGSVLFQRALRASLVTLVGLMAAVTVRFGLAISWDWLSVLLGLAAFTALRLGVDVLWVVLAGAGLALVLL
ncbi:MAG: chromate efflux transporter [Desulfovibrio sp.]|nr:MAG: chromate efflux transporter [Desulfovibrio sp.]